MRRFVLARDHYLHEEKRNKQNGKVDVYGGVSGDSFGRSHVKRLLINQAITANKPMNK
jgi:hypothetical protein